MRTSSLDPTNNTHNINYYTQFINGLPSSAAEIVILFLDLKLCFIVLKYKFVPQNCAARVF